MSAPTAGCVVPSASLVCEFYNLLLKSESLQQQVWRRLKIYSPFYLHEDSEVSTAAMEQPREPDQIPPRCSLWFQSSGHPPLPHGLATPLRTSDDAAARIRLSSAGETQCNVNVSDTSSSPRSGLGFKEVEMVLRLDAFAVAQQSPALIQSLFVEASPLLEVAAASAIVKLLSEVAGTALHGAQSESSDDTLCTMQIPFWGPDWLAALHSRSVSFWVQLLVLRTPTFLSLCCNSTSSLDLLATQVVRKEARAIAEASSLSRHSLPSSLSPIPSPSRSSGSLLSNNGGLRETISALSLAVMPSSYPPDHVLGIGSMVHVHGIVHQVFYEGRHATVPAPWITLLILPSRKPSGCWKPALDSSLERKDVDLRGLPPSQLRQISIVGELVEVWGRVQVGRHSNSMAAGHCESLLKDYIEASYAAAPFVEAVSGDQRASSCIADNHPAAGGLSPLSLAVPLQCPLQIPKAHQQCSLPCGTLSLTPSEETAAMWAALEGWEGCRLALGREVAPPPFPATDYMCNNAFATSMDIVVATLVAVLSAQTADGVTVLVVDEETPALLTSMVSQLAAAAPTAVVAFSASLLQRSRRSFFLPSYRFQRNAIPVSLASSGRSTVAPQPGQSSARAKHSSRGGVGICPQLPVFSETLQGGALTHAHCRAMVLHQVEVLPADTLLLLQDVLHFNRFSENCDCSGTAERCQSGNGTTAVELETKPNTMLRSRAIQREGGQLVPYRSTHSALCSIRDTLQFVRKSPLFEFGQRMDVVLRPAIPIQRQVLGLRSGADPAFQALMQKRGNIWCTLLGDVLALPSLASGPECATPAALYLSPQLTEACSKLLTTYFLATKAYCADGVDMGVMKTLVKLTNVHALWRTRLSHARQCRLKGSCGWSDSLVEDEKQKGGCLTALVDALVAINLCDSTLHFFTGKPLLQQCLFQYFEENAWAIPLSGGGAVASVTAAIDAQSGGDEVGQRTQAMAYLGTSYHNGDDDMELLEFMKEVEQRTRVASMRSSPLPEQVGLDGDGTFSIIQVVEDLITHLSEGL